MNSPAKTGASESHQHEMDVAVMLRVQRDEAGAFGELINLWWSPLFGLFFRQFNDRQEAEDLVQDVFLRLFRNRKRYRPSAKFATWIYHIARNVARNAIRTRRRRPAATMPIFEDADDNFVNSGPSDPIDFPSRSLERAEVADLVRKAVAGLKGRQRTAVELQCQDNSYSEIAAELQMTAKAAKSLLYRARTELRTALLPFSETFG